ncbi:MAG: 4Fe-4S dicluster domain-containing protein [Coriobacteriia bacterium]|nr:4Fe-4S dicluster domain-containing protein [Coriobacteriia bacterium]
MAQLGFFFDNSRCTGCKTCEMSCKDYKDLSESILFRKVYDFEGGSWTADDAGGLSTTTFVYHVSAACNHCVSPACQAHCPADAIIKDEDNGLVHIDEEACISCGDCVEACPFDVPRMDPITDLAVKCDGCIARIQDGKKPICVQACPLRALEMDDIEALRAEHGDLWQIPPLPVASTGPCLSIKPSPALDSPALDQGFVANELEVA